MDRESAEGSMSNLLSSIDARGVATITLNRVEVHNAFDDALTADLTDELTRLGSDNTVRGIALAANGKSFSAGGELGSLRRAAAQSWDDNYRDALALAGLMRTLNDSPKPTIARVHGSAFGGGVGLVACCDMAIAAEEATFSFSETKLGLIPAAISPYVVRA